MDMDHGDNTDGGMDDMCKMSMVFNWDPRGTCVVFEWWHIRGNWSLIFSFLAIVALGFGYEYLRNSLNSSSWLSSRQINLSSDHEQNDDEEEDDRLPSGVAGISLDSFQTLSSSSSSGSRSTLFSRPQPLLATLAIVITRYRKVVHAWLYSVLVVYSFFIMLIAMTYNAVLIFGIGLGAFLGHIAFSDESSTFVAKGLSCH
ncbi:Ctr copper transporter [Lipomyces oligophaga]|uniref:Ctr copper transporter n=1 Tax=Lipomyces oligophaga TaxID=45792 RepID=UPI0034CF164A